MLKTAVNHHILLRETFSPSISNGREAMAYREATLDPLLANGESVTLDFTGIRSANSSFVNALISGLFEQHGSDALQKLIFRGCLPTIQVLVQAAMDLGMTKHSERVS